MDTAPRPTLSAAPRSRRRVLYGLGATLGLLVLGYGTYSGAYLISNLDRNPDLAFSDGFESGDLSAWRVGDEEFCCDHSAKIVTGEARDGTRALKVHLRDSDRRVAGSKRAELRLQAVPLGEERWYGFSFLVPDDWSATPDLVTVAQWHAVDDRIFGEGGRAPPLRLIIKDDKWAISNQWDTRLLSGAPFRRASPQDGQLLWTGPFRRGAWTDWVFRVRWSYGDDGIVEIWKDGEQVAKRSGPNAYNDLLGPFFKLGIYIPQWNTEDGERKGRERTLLIDRVRQGKQPLVAADGRPVASTSSN